ncbi:MAG TPA: ATP-binding cassette domain-containing protein [Fibrobacteria bacterium]|nr:ATP-binding cassette domain-containing protein [Fibrobacteria bacterium]
MAAYGAAAAQAAGVTGTEMGIYELRDVRYEVRVKGQTRTILNVKELSLQEGLVTGIIGPNGAGKTTLLKVMAFLEAPAAGSITYRGQPVNPAAVPLSLRRRMATVFQQSLLLDMTVRQNVALGMRFRGLSKREQKARTDQWLARFKIEHLAHRHAHTLSGGEAQRVSLARALVLEPDILFLDEPFSALDFPTKIALMQDLKPILRETKTTTLFVSHDLLEVTFMTDHLVVMMNGEIVQEGPPARIIDAPNQRAEPFLRSWRTLAESLRPLAAKELA